MKRMHNVAGVILAMVFVMMWTMGCASVQEALSSLDRPTASVTGARLTDWTLDGATLNFDVDVSNPYSVALPLAHMDYDLASRGTRLVGGRAPLSGVIGARGRETITLPAKISFSDVLSVLRDSRPGAVVPYEATLALSVDAPGVGPIAIPLRRSGELPVPAAPRVSVENIAWEKIDLREAVALLTLNVENTNQFPLDLSVLDYALSLGGRQVANTRISEQISFSPGAAKTLEIPLTISPMDLGMGAVNMLRGDGATYDIGGAMDVNTPFGPINLPFQHAGRAPFSR